MDARANTVSRSPTYLSRSPSSAKGPRLSDASFDVSSSWSPRGLFSAYVGSLPDDVFETALPKITRYSRY